MGWLASSNVASAGPSTVLPVERVRMYEVGVAYFERSGPMKAGHNLELPLPAGHLDDALKTLVVLSPGGQAKLGGVAFETAVSDGAARAFAGLPEGGSDQLDYDVVLRSFEGQRVEVQVGNETTRGRLLEVEGPLPISEVKKGETPAAVERQWNLVLLDDTGSVRRLRTDTVKRVRPLDAGTKERIELAAASLSGQSAQRSHKLSLQVERAGKVELGYVAEAPVWRTSYRVVLTDDGQAVMQAWALIHNDTDEAWKGVQIELANGEPTSFLFPLAAPRYARRELQSPEVDLFTVPQLLLETADGMWADGTGRGYLVGESYGAAGLGSVGHGYGGGGSASGSLGSGTIGTIGHSSSLQIGDLADFAQADGSESEAQFVYRLAQKVDLPAHHSALVPVFASAIDARSITLFAGGGAEPMHGLRLVNSTRQSLPAGPVALFADGGFSGEAVLDRLKPGEPRYIPFGRDLDVELSRSEQGHASELRALTFNDGVVGEHRVERFDIVLRVDNRAGRKRNAYVALDLPRNAQLQSEAPLDWDPERGEAMVSIEVQGRSHTNTRVRAGTPSTAQHAVAGLTLKQLNHWAEDTSLSAKDRAALQRAALATREADALQAKADDASKGRSERLSELTRRRADLKALGAGGQRGEAARKTARRVEALENEIEALAKKGAEFSAQRVEKFRERDAALHALPRSPRVRANASAP